MSRHLLARLMPLTPGPDSIAVSLECGKKTASLNIHSSIEKWGKNRMTEYYIYH